MSKNLDETVCRHSEKREEWICDVSGQELQGITEGNSSATGQANSSTESQPRRNECPETH